MPFNWVSFTAKTSAKSIFLILSSGVTFLAKASFENCFSIEEGRP